jgi:V/A-type H+/Na+-transporting ATPase subunit E
VSLEAIGERILTEARTEAERIESSADKQAREMMAAAKEHRAGRMAQAVDAARREAERSKRQRLAQAKLAARDGVISAKQEIIDEAFRRAGQKIASVSGERYVDLLAGLISRRAAGGEEIVLDAADPQMNRMVIDRANALRTPEGEQIRLAPPKPGLGAGFVLRRQDVEESYLFRRLLESAREELEPEVAAIIFEERTR